MAKYNPKKTGDGAGKVVTDRRPVYIAFRLVNYDIDGPAMKSQHAEFIDQEILPVISTGAPWTVHIRGMCSRSGDYNHNMDLSHDRAAMVENYLRKALERDRRRTYRIDRVGVGFTTASGQSDKDGADDRAVLIEVFNAFQPPKPPKEKPDPPPNPHPGPSPAYENDGIPMFPVPDTTRYLMLSQDNSVAFSAGQVVDVHVGGVGAGPVQIKTGNEKRSVVPEPNGKVEQFATLGRVPIPWKFEFTLTSAHLTVNVASVRFYSDWVPGMPRPDNKGQPKSR
jgi:hypothetical protein